MADHDARTETPPHGGWKLVPYALTDAMYDAFASVNCTRSDIDERFTFSGDFGNFIVCYQAMLNAAPAPLSASAALDAEWCMDAFWRVNPGRNATVPSLYLLAFAREVLRVHAARSSIEPLKLWDCAAMSIDEKYRPARPSSADNGLLQIAEVMAATGASAAHVVELIRASRSTLERTDDGFCRSCVGGLCVTGPECVTTSNTRNGKGNGYSASPSRVTDRGDDAPRLGAESGRGRQREEMPAVSGSIDECAACGGDGVEPNTHGRRTCTICGGKSRK